MARFNVRYPDYVVLAEDVAEHFAQLVCNNFGGKCRRMQTTATDPERLGPEDMHYVRRVRVDIYYQGRVRVSVHLLDVCFLEKQGWQVNSVTVKHPQDVGVRGHQKDGDQPTRTNGVESEWVGEQLTRFMRRCQDVESTGAPR